MSLILDHALSPLTIDIDYINIVVPDHQQKYTFSPFFSWKRGIPFDRFFMDAPPNTLHLVETEDYSPSARVPNMQLCTYVLGEEIHRLVYSCW
jgi:hypothetical protein